jgi:hypothetical protein
MITKRTSHDYAEALGYQEPGGRCVITHEQLAERTGQSRPSVTIGMQHLMCARLVSRIGNGVYQLNPMLAGFRTPVEQMRAVEAMPEEDRLDVQDFEERFEQRRAEYEANKRRRSGVQPGRPAPPQAAVRPPGPLTGAAAVLPHPVGGERKGSGERGVRAAAPASAGPGRRRTPRPHRRLPGSYPGMWDFAAFRFRYRGCRQQGRWPDHHPQEEPCPFA